MKKDPSVAIIVLNWNRWQDTIRCLESIYQSTYTDYAVIIVDNGSIDGSVEKIKKWANGEIRIDSKFFKYSPDNKPVSTVIVAEQEATAKGDLKQEAAAGQLLFIACKKNNGFAKGNNIAIDYASYRLDVQYIMLLNNDTVVLPNCIQELVHTAEHGTRAGSYQPKMLSMNDPDIIDALGISMIDFQCPFPIGNGYPDTEQFNSCREIFGVCAGAALYRRTMLDQIGLFDEDFFAYYEDVDLALRACLMGWKALCVPDAIVYHGHSATLGKESPLKTYLLERNRYYYIIKNLPRDMLWLFINGRPDAFLRSLIQLLKTRSFQHANALLRGNLKGLVGLPSMCIKRWKLRSSGQVHDSELRKWLSK